MAGTRDAASVDSRQLPIPKEINLGIGGWDLGVDTRLAFVSRRPLLAPVAVVPVADPVLPETVTQIDLGDRYGGALRDRDSRDHFAGRRDDLAGVVVASSGHVDTVLDRAGADEGLASAPDRQEDDLGAGERQLAGGLREGGVVADEHAHGAEVGGEHGEAAP